jgi:hypothetical protein
MQLSQVFYPHVNYINRFHCFINIFAYIVKSLLNLRIMALNDEYLY